jgi:hypothetical protein
MHQLASVTEEKEKQKEEFVAGAPKSMVSERRQDSVVVFALFLVRQLVAVRLERGAERLQCAAACRICMACAARLACLRSKLRLGIGRSGSSDRQRAAKRQRCDDSSQDSQIHFSSPLMERTRNWYSNFRAGELISINTDVRRSRLFQRHMNSERAELLW